MDKYFQLEPDNYLDYGVTGNPSLPDGASFNHGEIITAAIPDPLPFKVSFPSPDEIPHLTGNAIPTNPYGTSYNAIVESIVVK